jgi:peptidoglycan/LPS O-acetylase OafA/YrhL
LTGLLVLWAIAISAFGADPRTPASGFSHIFYFAGASCAAAIAIIALRYKPAILSTALPQFFGEISYSLYLTHSTIGFLVLRSMLGDGVSEVMAIGLAVMASVAVGFLLNITVEKPGRLALAKLLNLHRPALPRTA